MGYKINVNQKTCLEMQPMDALNFFDKEMEFEIPDGVVGEQEQKVASKTLIKAHAYASFFTEMEMKAKLLKREMKFKKEKEEADRYMGLEEVFKTYKEVSKLQIDSISKMMTLKRLELDDKKSFVYGAS